VDPVGGPDRSVLVVANDGLPYPGCPVSGSGLRAWGLGQGLTARGHDVRFAMPAEAAAPGLPNGEGGPLLYDGVGLREVIERTRPDVLVFQHWPRVGVADDLDVPVALDLHGPLMIEAAFQRRADEDRAELARVKTQAFRRADFISCAGEKQRQYFLPWLMLAGGDPTVESIEVIPVSLSPDVPEHVWESDEVNFVYGGMFLPWQDPSLGLATLVSVLESEGRGRLDFFGAPHPQFEMALGVFEDLEARLRRSSRVAVRGLRPRDELLDHYRRSYAALDLMRRNNERELAFTTRTVEYLWCGLPVVYHDYGELSSMISEYEAGWVTPADDVAGLEKIVRGILRDPEEVRRRSRNAQRLARERLNWDRTIEPLDAFCRHPERARRHGERPLLVDPREADALQAELDALTSTKTFRMLRPVRELYGRLRR
jgi:hypothetical protein